MIELVASSLADWSVARLHMGSTVLATCVLVGHGLKYDNSCGTRRYLPSAHVNL